MSGYTAALYPQRPGYIKQLIGYVALTSFNSYWLKLG